MEVWTVYNRNKLFWSCDLPWVEVWTVYNYQWIALIMWFILSGSMNCIQLSMDCSDRVIYLEWKYELHTTINGLFWSYCDLSWVEVWTAYNLNGLFWSCDLPWVEVWTVYNWKWIVPIMWFTLSGRMNCIQLEMDCPNRVIYLEWKYELYTTGNGLFWSCDLPWVEVWTVYNWNGLFWSYCDLPWVEVWTVYNWKRVVLIILWFTLSSTVNCIQLEADCSDHIVIYLEWKCELYATGSGLFWSCFNLPWVEVWTVYNWKRIVLILLWFRPGAN
jgi:hypothetical protein